MAYFYTGVPKAVLAMHFFYGELITQSKEQSELTHERHRICTGAFSIVSQEANLQN